MSRKLIKWQEQKKKNKKEIFLTKTELDKMESLLPPKLPRSHNVAVGIESVSKSFELASNKIMVLKEIDLTLYAGEFVIIYGPSGCGKSTLLHTILGLEEPNSGRVLLRSEDIYKMTADERTNYRRKKIGVVFQQSNWIKSLSVLENVAYPLWLDGWTEKAARQKVYEVIEEVGMSKHMKNKATELSGGQQQKVALARALATDPWIIVCDEPTGNLDSISSNEIMTLLAKLNREKRRMIVMVTHNLAYLSLATRRIGIKDGQVVIDERDKFKKKKR